MDSGDTDSLYNLWFLFPYLLRGDSSIYFSYSPDVEMVEEKTPWKPEVTFKETGHIKFNPTTRASPRINCTTLSTPVLKIQRERNPWQDFTAG